ncbi:hypothetical protein [Actinomadura rudentiformis]|nr:hypothetical protein [Actinomadura rudentiformis]
MNVTVSCNALADAVTRVITALDGRPATPALAGLLLEAQDGVLAVTGAGSGQAGRLEIDTTEHQRGAVLVDARFLARIARHLPEETATLEAAGDHLVICSGSATWRLVLMPEDDYPDWVAGLLAERNAAEFAKPKGLDGWEIELGAGERRLERAARLWTPPRFARTPFEPRPFEAGDWVTVTTDTETLLGQMATRDLVVWIRGDQTIVEQVQTYRLSGTELERYVRRSSAVDGEVRQWSWPLQRSAAPADEAFVPELTPAAAPAPVDGAATVAASVGSTSYRTLPEVFEFQWPDLDYPPVPS